MTVSVTKPFKILFFLLLCLVMVSCRTAGIKEVEQTGADPADRVSPNESYLSPSISYLDRSGIDKNDPAIRLQGEGSPSLPPEGAIQVGIKDAVLLSLENNRSLAVERLTPLIRRTSEENEQARFDPQLTGTLSYSRGRSREQTRNSPVLLDNTASEVEAGATVSRYFPSGTEIAADVTLDRTWSDWYSDFNSARLGVSITQALLRGAGSDVNLASLRQARLDTRASSYELRGFAEALIAEVEKTYWEYALSLRQIEIYEESLKVANQYLNETKEIISVGRLAETELIAAEAEIALRRQDLIDAKSEMETTRLRLLRQLNPPGSDMWQRKIDLLDMPSWPDIPLDKVEAHVEVGLRMRPDLNQARLSANRNELELVRTKNGLLPKLEAFVSLGKTGYSDSFDSSFDDIFDNSYDAFAGITLEYPVRNRDARADHRRAVLDYGQELEAVKNLAQIVEVDVRSAYIQVNRAKEQVFASAATRKLQEDKLRIENERFRVGRSTSFQVAQAWRDRVSSQIAEVQATVRYIIALIELYRLEGSLLERRGISAPGREPVKLLLR